MKKIFYILTIVALITACKADFLDKKPLDKYSEDVVFNSPALAEAYVNALYTILPDPFQEGNISCITDEGFFRYGGTSTRYIASGNMDASNVMYMQEGGGAHNTRTTTLNIWNRAYERIYNMNYFIHYIENKGSKIEVETLNRLMGEVYFLRAWAYYNLIQRYAGVPIIKKPSNIDDDFSMERNKFDDCVDFILEDLDQAEALVPAKEKAVMGRINKDVVLALRARLTLIVASKLFNDPDNPEGGILRGQYDKAKWTRAYNANKAIVDRADVDGAYSLDPNYDGYWKNIASPELIWAKYFTNLGRKAQLYYSVVYFNGWCAMNPTQAMMLDYEMTNGKKFFEEGSGYDPKHPYKNRDPRLYKTCAIPFSKYYNTDKDGLHENELLLYLLYDGKTMADFAVGKPFVEHTSKAKHLWHATNTTGIELNKWYIPELPINEDECGSRLYPWFRLAEFYLNFAECAYMEGKEEECRTYINKVRSRADVNMPAVTETGASLWDRLVNERRIEMAFEFVRYFDVRRWKVADFYENIPFAGMRTMILKKGAVQDTVYRVARLYDESKNNTNYYWPNSPDRAAYVEANFGRDIKHIVTYKWLGKEYKIDYGDCCLTISPTQKYFPEDGRNYLMPIPQIEISKSRNTIAQNPGY